MLDNTLYEHFSLEQIDLFTDHQSQGGFTLAYLYIYVYIVTTNMHIFVALKQHANLITTAGCLFLITAIF